MNNSKRLLAIAVSAALAAPMAAYATNGMNLEGYGPIATAMGGASMAYDNGTAAMMNNPATLGMMGEGSRLEVALGNLRPDVTIEAGGDSWSSGETSFMMPAMGYVRSDGQLTYGVGMFAQGGMGSSYDQLGGGMASFWMQDSFGDAAVTSANMMNLTSLEAAYGTVQQIIDPAMTLGATDAITRSAAPAALEERSEVGVGRLIFPVSYQVDDKLTVGGSIDYVWAGMDLQMVMGGQMMADMMFNPNSEIGSIGGSMAGLVQNFVHSDLGGAGPFGIASLDYGYFDFTNDSPYTGEAMGFGFAGKIGGTFKVNDKLTIGATYHTKTSMSNLKAEGAKVTMGVAMLNTSGLDSDTLDLDGLGNGTAFSLASGDILDMAVPLTGTMEVVDFQWPATMSLGMAYQANEKVKVVADIKRVNWSEVMKSFDLKFTANSSNDFSGMVPGMNFNGTVLTASMNQNWEDQTVMQLGGEYQLNQATALRAGYNYASNPVPSDTLNYLFPAVTETHYTFGVGHALDDKRHVDFSLAYVPETKVTNPGAAGTAEDPMDMSASMAQINWQLMYSHGF